MVKSMVVITQNVVAFSEYMNFTQILNFMDRKSPMPILHVILALMSFKNIAWKPRGVYQNNRFHFEKKLTPLWSVLHTAETGKCTSHEFPLFCLFPWYHQLHYFNARSTIAQCAELKNIEIKTITICFKTFIWLLQKCKLIGQNKTSHFPWLSWIWWTDWMNIR